MATDEKKEAAFELAELNTKEAKEKKGNKPELEKALGLATLHRKKEK